MHNQAQIPALRSQSFSFFHSTCTRRAFAILVYTIPFIYGENTCFNMLSESHLDRLQSKHSITCGKFVFVSSVTLDKTKFSMATFWLLFNHNHCCISTCTPPCPEFSDSKFLSISNNNRIHFIWSPNLFPKNTFKESLYHWKTCRFTSLSFSSLLFIGT